MILTTLYRHFDAAGRLLYVGKTFCFAKRQACHRKNSAWFKSVRTITLEHFATASEAAAAERAAIKAERPIHNKAHKERVLATGREYFELSPKEKIVLSLLNDGRRVGEIAKVLGISHKTVSTHKARISTKMGIFVSRPTRREVVRRARDLGIASGAP